MPASKRRGRLTATIAALALSVTPLAVAAAADAAPSDSVASTTGRGWPAPRPIRLDLLAINDFHGNLDKPTGSAGRITAGTTDYTAGGAAYLATHLDALRKQAKRRGAHTLTVAAGDLLGASPLLSAAFHDEPSVEALNKMGLDVAAVGNHEFDEGYRELLRMQFGGCLPDGDGADGQNSCPDPKRKFRGADYQYLAANVRYAGTRRTVFPGYTVRRVGGVKVGFIGMTLENTPNIVTKAGVEGLTFHDEVETANALVPKLRRQGVRSIIVLLHEGGSPAVSNEPDGCPDVTGPGVEIAEELHPEIDVVVSGHTHAAYNCTVKDPAGKPRLFTSASSFGRVVTDISLEINRWTRDVRRPTATARNHIVTNDEGTTPRRDIVRLISRYTELVAPIRDAVIGRLEGADLVSREADDDGGDSPLGNLIADAQLADPSVIPAGGEAPVIAFMNPGGIRADLVAEDGAVTYGAAFTVQPFNNYVVSMTLTGEQVLAVLNEQWNGTNEGSNRILQVAGLSYTWDRSEAAAPDTDAIVDSVKVDLDRDGTFETDLDPQASYRVVVNSFLADGGDGFGTLAEGADRYFGGLDIDSLATYLAANDPYTPTQPDRISSVD